MGASVGFEAGAAVTVGLVATTMAGGGDDDGPPMGGIGMGVKWFTKACGLDPGVASM